MIARGKGNDADPTTKIASDDVSDLLPRLAIRRGTYAHRLVADSGASIIKASAQ